MALVVYDRVQEITATTGTGSITLGGAVTGYQSFAVVGNGNTVPYCIINGTQWEVGIGTYSTTGPTLARTTVLSNSDGNTSPITLVGASNVLCTYPAEKNVFLDASGNVTPLGTIASATWQASTVGVAYGGTGVTSSSGANSVVLRDANQNISVNSVTQEVNKTTSAAGTTTLTAASPHFQILTGTTTQTYKLPDATTLLNGSSWIFDNDSTGNLTVTDNAGATVDVVAPGGYSTVFLESNATVGGEWGRFGMLPNEVNWGTTSADLGNATITNAVWNGTPIASGYGGTGLTTFTAANYALYSTSASALTAGTLPIAAGGTGNTSGQAASVANALTFNNSGTGDASGGTYNGSSAKTISYNSIGAQPAGTYVNSVSGTSPVVSSGGTTPAISLASGYGDTQNPYASKTANYFLAAPNGSAGVPTFRAVVAADIPTLNQNTTGQAGSVANALSAGTGLNFTGGGTYNGGAAKTVNIADTAVTPGSYTYASITVDQQGRLTAASSGAAPSAFPAGTAILFYQAAAPTGWTKSTTNNDKALRVVSGTSGGSAGGSVAFSTAFASQTPSGTVSVSVSVGTLAGTIGTLAATVGTLAGTIGSLTGSAVTLSTAQIPSHSHPIAIGSGVAGGNSVFNISHISTGNSSNTSFGTEVTGGGGSHTHTLSGSPGITGTPGLTGTPGISGSPSVTSSTFSGNAINLAVQYCDVIICTKD